MIHSLCAALALSMAVGQVSPRPDPIDLAQGQAAPFAGTLTVSSAWLEAAQARQELERQLAEAKAKPCSSSNALWWGLVSGGLLFVAGAAVGVLAFRK